MRPLLQPRSGSVNKSLPATVLRLFQGNPKLRPGPHGSLIDFVLSENLKSAEPAPWVLNPAWISRILEETQGGKPSPAHHDGSRHRQGDARRSRVGGMPRPMPRRKPSPRVLCPCPRASWKPCASTSSGRSRTWPARSGPSPGRKEAGVGSRTAAPHRSVIRGTGSPDASRRAHAWLSASTDGPARSGSFRKPL